jgi:hypothetical protein
MVNLCSKCRQADKTCPIYSPSEEVYKCVEWKPVVDILLEDFVEIVYPNCTITIL